MKKINVILFLLLGIFVLSCNKETIPKEQEITPPDITYTILDSGKVVFKNTFPDKYKFHWGANGISYGIGGESYGFVAHDSFIIFLSNGKKKVGVGWKDSLGVEQSKIFELDITNAISSRDTSYIKGVYLGKYFEQLWYPLISGGNFVSNGYGDFIPVRAPMIDWATRNGPRIFMADLNEESSYSLSEFRKNLKVGPQPLAVSKPGVFPTTKDDVDKKGWILIFGVNPMIDIDKQKLEILEIKETPLQKLYSGMEENVSIWITWYYTNGQEGDKKLNLPPKRSIFLRNKGSYLIKNRLVEYSARRFLFYISFSFKK